MDGVKMIQSRTSHEFMRAKAAYVICQIQQDFTQAQRCNKYFGNAEMNQKLHRVKCSSS